MANPNSSSSSFKNPLATFFPMIETNTDHSYLNSMYIYFKLFLYYPLKYIALLYIFLIIYKILLLVYKYGILAIQKIVSFFRVLIACGLVKKCTKKNKGKDCCELDLIIFKVPDVFKLFAGVLDAVVGIIYAAITIVLLIICAALFIPFNFIFPSYNAII